jgi:hypothetical protein
MCSTVKQFEIGVIPMRATIAIAVTLLLVMGWEFAGCSNSTQQSPAPADSTETTAGTEGAADAEIAAAFAELSAEDRAVAEKQKICPVSGELLGKMGPPIKVDVQGQPVFICCEACQEDLLAKPDEYLAKLKK